MTTDTITPIQAIRTALIAVEVDKLKAQRANADAETLAGYDEEIAALEEAMWGRPMKTARYGVESISIWCPECFAIQDNEDTDTGSQQFLETEVERLPAVMECQYCDVRFRKPKYPVQRRQSA